MANHNRAALNRLYRERERIEKEAWLAEHYEQEEQPVDPHEDPLAAALRRMAEDQDIAARRAAYPLH